ncbi:hypothetical protein [Paenibacillus macquariensis]|uniref:Uncharacterized protein n=1 Tax=Paenibacillus macquariensis TaxID=948756 RepID=A0ABY1K749_9BACL|nr:hypothetical protein [Paenibacillus macquariensis]MEC0092499.1 hypothetical protein [Paenibacillus macquariensis]OAB35457.1 hypothetical protein PMSM_09380 [Paenibacillus macquariensis subsp. macquariensis]SIR35341.1 hypothetical protein SAMN05421578_111167 [Paenibacillus macquariensis]
MNEKVENIVKKNETTPQKSVSTEKKAKDTATKVADEQLIYVGPTIERGILRQHQVFKGGHPACLENLFTKYPLLKSLFVPVDQLNSAQIDLSKKGTSLNAAYTAMKGV